VMYEKIEWGVSTMLKERCRCPANKSMGSVGRPLFVIMRALAKREKRLTFVVSKAEVVLQETCLDSPEGYWSWRNVSHLNVWIERGCCGGTVSVGGGSEGPIYLMVPTQENRSRCQPGFLWMLLRVSEGFHHFRSLRRCRY
jgi:hypothetical protein